MGLLARIPWVLLAIGFGLYQGYEYYLFEYDDTSEKLVKKAEIERVGAEIETEKNRYESYKRFMLGLQAQKAGLAELAVELQTMKGQVGESLDVPKFIKTIVTEAQRVGLKVQSIRPVAERKEEFVVAQEFEMAFSGIYAQSLVFLQRIAVLQNIIRVGSITLNPTGPRNMQYVDISGKMKFDVYKYSVSEADIIAGKLTQTATEGTTR